LGWGALKAGARGVRGLRGRVAQARGRWAWRGQTAQFGPVQRSNAALNSYRDAVGGMSMGFGRY
jgi:hypothetical protein